MNTIRRAALSLAILVAALLPAFTTTYLLGAAPSAQAATYGPDVRVQVLIEAKTSEGTFKDALYYTKAEFDALSDAQVASLKAARVTAWVAAVQAAKQAPPPVVTKEDLQAEKAQLEARLAVLNAEIAKK